MIERPEVKVNLASSLFPSFQLGQNFVDEVPELRCRGESRRLSGCEMLDTSCAAGLGTVLALLQLEHEGVVGAHWNDWLGHGETPAEVAIERCSIERFSPESPVQGKTGERSIQRGERKMSPQAV
jgi:hypothetical protein